MARVRGGRTAKQERQRIALERLELKLPNLTEREAWEVNILRRRLGMPENPVSSLISSSNEKGMSREDSTVQESEAKPSYSTVSDPQGATPQEATNLQP